MDQDAVRRRRPRREDILDRRRRRHDLGRRRQRHQRQRPEPDGNPIDADGNAIVTIDRQRFDNETATGALGDPNTTPKARVYYAATYYDAADRLTATVDVGTNGGTAWTRPSTRAGFLGHGAGDQQHYNAAGWVQDR